MPHRQDKKRPSTSKRLLSGGACCIACRGLESCTTSGLLEYPPVEESESTSVPGFYRPDERLRAREYFSPTAPHRVACSLLFKDDKAVFRSRSQGVIIARYQPTLFCCHCCLLLLPAGLVDESFLCEMPLSRMFDQTPSSTIRQ